MWGGTPPALRLQPDILGMVESARTAVSFPTYWNQDWNINITALTPAGEVTAPNQPLHSLHHFRWWRGWEMVEVKEVQEMQEVQEVQELKEVHEQEAHDQKEAQEEGDQLK